LSAGLGIFLFVNLVLNPTREGAGHIDFIFTKARTDFLKSWAKMICPTGLNLISLRMFFE